MREISARNGFHCVPVVRTYFLVIQHTIMVSKVSQKNFEVCAIKRHKPLNFDVQKFRCAFGCTYLIFFANPLYPCCSPKKILLTCWKVKVPYPVIHGFGGRTKKKLPKAQINFNFLNPDLGNISC